MKKSTVLVLILLFIAVISGGGSLYYVRASYIPLDASRFNANGHFYKVFHERLTWKEANDRCIIMNGYLACITTPSENDFMLSLAQKQTYPEYTCCWIGATDEKEELKWRWITGELLVMEDNFLVEGGQSENYLNLRLATGQWEDYTVDGEQVGEQWFVCEWD